MNRWGATSRLTSQHPLVVNTLPSELLLFHDLAILDVCDRKDSHIWLAHMVYLYCTKATRSIRDGAGTRDRTGDTSLEGWGFTAKLCPRL